MSIFRNSKFLAALLCLSAKAGIAAGWPVAAGAGGGLGSAQAAMKAATAAMPSQLRFTSASLLPAGHIDYLSGEGTAKSSAAL